MMPVPTAPLGQSAMNRAPSVCARRSAWTPTRPCAAATAAPTTASASCTCGPASSRWTSAWSARESAVSDACIRTRSEVLGRLLECTTSMGKKNKTQQRCTEVSKLNFTKNKSRALAGTVEYSPQAGRQFILETKFDRWRITKGASICQREGRKLHGWHLI